MRYLKLVQIVTMAERRRPEKSEVGALMCDASGARQLLGWEPTVSLHEGFRQTADYVTKRLEQYKHWNSVI